MKYSILLVGYLMLVLAILANFWAGHLVLAFGLCVVLLLLWRQQ